MKLIKKLKKYAWEDAEDSIFGFGIIRSMDYDKMVAGHLIIFSVHIGNIRFIKKLWVQI